MYVMRGMGQSAGQIAAIGQPVAVAAGAAPLAGAIGVGVPVAGAFIAAGIMAVSAVVSAIENSGCGESCIITSDWANAAEKALQQNIAAYFALPAPRSQSNQAAALSNFDRVWASLVAQCQGTNTTAGQRCITDRQAGACIWKQPASSVPAWGTPAAGECWNWFNGYRDPIANDPNVVEDSVAASAASAVSTLLPAGSSFLPLLAIAAGVFLVFKLAG